MTDPARPADPTPPASSAATPSASAPAAPAAGGQPYGPQTLAIRRFLQHLAALPATEWEAIAAGFAAHAAQPAFVRADRALGLVVERAGRETERDAALGPLVQLVRLPRPADAPPPTEDEEVPLHPVAEPALAAVLALLVRDLLPEASFAALYAPVAAHVPAERLSR